MLAERLKELRNKNNLTQKQFAAIFNIASGTIAMWETNKRRPDSEMLANIADYFNVSVDYLLGKEKKTPDFSEVDYIISFAGFKQIPIIGTIACGEPILAEENIEGYTNVELNIHADFALRCKGDSMAPKFLDGDIVLIRQQPVVENGQIAAVLIGSEATLKRVYVNPHDILLAPENLNYQPMIYQEEEMSNIRILGLAIGYTRIF